MDTKNPALLTLQFAVGRFDKQADFAKAINRSKQEVWNWLNRDKKAPIDACPFIVEACKHRRVTCEKLRPDYGDGWALLRRQFGGASST